MIDFRYDKHAMLTQVVNVSPLGVVDRMSLQFVPYPVSGVSYDNLIIKQ